MTEHTTTSDHHTVRAFDSDLQEIARKVAAMGGLAEKQITDAIGALVDHDTDLAEHVIATDPMLDAMRHEIEQKAVETLARRQPVAVDLREIIAAMRLCNDIERIGDHANHIGRRVIALGAELYPESLASSIERMADLALSLLKQVLDAYACHDVQATLAVWAGDEEVDALCTSLFRELLTYMMEDPRNITVCMDLMFCAKDIERIGDRATNIAETVYYMIEGHEIIDQRPKGDPTSFHSALMQKKKNKWRRRGWQSKS